jgi:hypothetical protein
MSVNRNGETMRANRREFLKISLGATALFLPMPFAWVWAQSEGAVTLLKAPKLALVVGNSRYKDAPELKNPANDAKGIGETLKAAGFEVNTLLDAGREQLLGAIRGYVQAMEQKKAVGLFYFAGHGVQLAWRNYMLPIDAVIDKIDDVGKQSVDIARLMEGLTKAGNPMNVIILDACRENPFGKDLRVKEKGLSQMDAPTRSILAYATSPGNVASDGDGANGLYTENLLREMKVPEAKIEDVFKRVRLGVRRKTNGAQIPWESTSLEEDFWFLPPKELREISEAEKEKQFDAELALWEKVQDSKGPAPLEDYLRRYPSGRFSELAQLALDRVLARQGEKRIVVVSAKENPYSKGSVMADLRYKLGDTYSYRELDLETKAQKRTFSLTVTDIRENEVMFDRGLILDLLGNLIQLPDGRRYTPRQDHPLEFAVGRRWTTRFSVSNDRTGKEAALEAEFHISGKERITVPAGTFDCYVVEGLAQGLSPGGARPETRTRRWFAPDQVRRPIASETVRKVIINRTPKPGAGPPGGGFRRMPKAAPNLPPTERIEESTRMELVSFKQG